MATSTLSRMGRPKKDEPTDPIRVPRSFARKLRRLALHAKKDAGDYLADEFGEALGRRHAKMVEELARAEEGDDEPGK